MPPGGPLPSTPHPASAALAERAAERGTPGARGEAGARLTLRGVHKRWGSTPVLRGVDLEVAPGSIHALIGPNGAGKSSLFNVVSGQAAPDAGQILLDGRPIGGLATHRIARLGIARSFQISQLFETLSVYDNLRCAALGSGGHGYAFWRLLDRLRGVTARAEAVARAIGLADRLQARAGQLGYAGQRALELGIALASGARLLLLDEPTAGMNRAEADHMAGLVRRAAEGRTVMIVEHDMDVVFALADRVTVMAEGRVVASGTPADIREDELARDVYLGAARPAQPGGRAWPRPARPRAASTAAARSDEGRSGGSAPGAVAAPSGLVVADLHAHYGDRAVLRGVDLRVGAGELVAVLGRNGAGRSTLARALLGLVARRGSVRWNGHELAGLAPHEIARRGIGYVPEGREVFPGMTVTQNLLLGVAPGQDGAGRLDAVYGRFPMLARRAQAEAQSLSGGEQQMLALCRALMGDPGLLVVDEPSEGLSPQAAETVADLLAALRADGMAILLIEQRLVAASRLADRVVVMGQGRLVFEGDADALRAAEAVRRRWLEL